MHTSSADGPGQGNRNRTPGHFQELFPEARPQPRARERRRGVSSSFMPTEFLCKSPAGRARTEVRGWEANPELAVTQMLSTILGVQPGI